jgi:hypothetical protein
MDILLWQHVKVSEDWQNPYSATLTRRPQQSVKIKPLLHGIPINPLTPELNPSAQRCLTKFFTGDFAS